MRRMPGVLGFSLACAGGSVVQGVGLAKDTQSMTSKPQPPSAQPKSAGSGGRSSGGSTYSPGRSGPLPPYIPNGSFTYSEVEDAKLCPVLLQITDAPTRIGAKGKWMERGSSRSPVKGEAPFQWLARDFELVSRSSTQAVWTAVLNADYIHCQAVGYLATRGRAKLNEETSHISIEMENGLLRLTLDLARLPEGAQITAAQVDEGIPSWGWVYRSQ
jgi:hypothetical protein